MHVLHRDDRNAKKLETQQEWHKNNPGEAAEYQQKRLKNNPGMFQKWNKNKPEKVAENRRKFRENNPGYKQEWNRNNPEKVAEKMIQGMVGLMERKTLMQYIDRIHPLGSARPRVKFYMIHAYSSRRIHRSVPGM